MNSNKNALCIRMDRCVLIQFTYRTQRRSSSDHISDVFRIEVAVGDVVLNHKVLAHGVD